MNPHKNSPPRRTSYVVAGVLGLGLSLGGGVFALAASNGDRVASSPDHGSGGIVSKPDPDKGLRLLPKLARKSIAAGETATYRIGVHRRRVLIRPARGTTPRLRARVRLRVSGQRPAGVTVTITPRSSRSPRATLRLQTSSRIRPGTYRFRVRGHGRLGSHPHHRTHHAWTWVTLVVVPPRKQITVQGAALERLAPGVSAPVDLYLTNPNRAALKVTELDVRVARVHAPAADAAHPCTTADFVVQQYTGGYGITLPASTTRKLSSIGIPSARWPHLAMANRTVNQDGCKGARVQLRFAATVAGDHS